MRAFRTLPLVLIGTFLGFAWGCEKERRVPYIVPELQNWPQPYEGKTGLELQSFSVGTLDVLEGAVLQGGSLTRRRSLPVFAYVLKHPTEGLVVINTGMSHRFVDGHASIGGLLGMAIDVHVDPGEDLPSQMQGANLTSEAVRWVILSDLRFMNTGELEAFTNARVVVTRAEHQNAYEGGGEYVRGDFDDVESWKLIDFADATPIGTMHASVDLFGDGSCLIVEAPGQTEGGVGVLLRLRNHAVFLAGSLVPVPETLRYAATPSFLPDADAWWQSIWRLKKFSELEPALLVVSEHADETLRGADEKSIVVHDFEARSPTKPATPSMEMRRSPAPP